MRADELDAGDVAILRGAVVDRPQGGLLLAQLADDLLDLLIGDARGLELERVVGVRAELDVRANRHRGGERDGLALCDRSRVDVDMRLVDRDDLGLVERAVVRVADEVVDRLGQDAAAADEAVDDLARRLARPEPGHLRALGDVPVGGGEMLVDLGRWDLDLEDHLRPGFGSRGDGDQVSSR